MVQVMYDALESMNCLAEMNTDNLEKSDSKVAQIAPGQVPGTFEEVTKPRKNYPHIQRHC